MRIWPSGSHVSWIGFPGMDLGNHAAQLLVDILENKENIHNIKIPCPLNFHNIAESTLKKID
jgi:hypothetical protein